MTDVTSGKVQHFLIAEACRDLFGRGQEERAIRTVLSRAFVHAEMARASKSFMTGKLPSAMNEHFATIPDALVAIAGIFVKSQELRHRADYDLTPDVDFSLKESGDLIGKIESAISDWKSIRDDRAARLYLVSLLSWDKFRK